MDRKERRTTPSTTSALSAPSAPPVPSGPFTLSTLSTPCTPSTPSTTASFFSVYSFPLLPLLPPLLPLRRNFGGQERLAQLQRMLQCLSDRGTHLLIISLGRTECIAAHLKAVNLLRYFPSEHIYGRDSPDLRKHRCGGLFCKALLILELMTRASWLPHEVCFKLLFAPRSLLSPALPPRPLSLSLSGSGVVWACV